MVEESGEPPQVLRGCRQQDLILDATQAAQPEPVEPENPFHVGKSHLDLLALAVRLLEGRGIGQSPDLVAQFFVEVAGHFARHGRGALGLQQAARAIILAGSVINCMALVDVACAGQFGSPWTNIDIAGLVEDEVCPAELAIGAYRFVPNGNVRCDVAIRQLFEQLDCAIDRVAREPFGPQIEAAIDTVHHGLGDRDLDRSVRSRTYGIHDDASLVIDQIVRIKSKERIDTRPRTPGCLRIGQRDLLGRRAWLASFTGAVVVSSAILIIAGIEDGEILADRMGRFFCLRPGNRLITRHSLLLVDVRLDQARIDGKRLAADQSGRNAHTHYTLEDPSQGVTLAEAFLSRTAEH